MILQSKYLQKEVVVNLLLARTKIAYKQLRFSI